MRAQRKSTEDVPNGDKLSERFGVCLLRRTLSTPSSLTSAGASSEVRRDDGTLK